MLVNDPEVQDLVAQWKMLTECIDSLVLVQESFARRRQEVTRQLASKEGATRRALGLLLGVSNVTVTNILHRDETKPGRKEPQ